MFLKAAHAPNIMYENADKAGSAEAPKVDVYTAGLPCQPWSSEGKSKGFKDADGRGRVFDHVAKYIKEREPKGFLLENVRALTFKTHQKAFENMLGTLRASGRYFITWRLLNCRDFGIPQSRPRLYIVGLRRDAVAASAGPGFPWPMKKTGVAPLPLKRFLCGGPGVLKPKPPAGSRAACQLHIATKTIINKHSSDPSTQPWVVECLSGRDPPQCLLGIVPCITRTRAANGGHWVTQLGRFLTVEEMLNLQGLPVPCPGEGAPDGAHRCADRTDGRERDPHERAHAALGPDPHEAGPGGALRAGLPSLARTQPPGRDGGGAALGSSAEASGRPRARACEARACPLLARRLD